VTESGKLPDVASSARYRIGELARLAGPAVSTLRTWQDRYPGLLCPTRTTGGHRLYDDADLTAVREMQRLVAVGTTVAVAAAQVIADRRAWSQATRGSEHGRADEQEVARTWWAGSAGEELEGLRAAHQATRAILRAGTPGQVAAALASFVRAVGGTVRPAGDPDPDAIPLDVSLGVDAPALPHAAPGSPARRRLEALLPDLVEDARLAGARLRAARRMSSR
jgi:DNA-binding transcriptional MerR regulator